MAVSFPSNPTVGQTVSDPDTGATWVWNGTAWVAQAGAGPMLPLAGGTMTGPLILSGSGAQPLAAATVSQVGVNVGRNFIHNPQFSVNQRNAGPYAGIPGSTSYTVDRWLQILAATGDSNTVIAAFVLSDADRAAIGDENAATTVSSTFTGGTGAGNSIIFGQRIENVQRLSNKTCTLSFWAMSPTSLSLGIAYSQNFGTGGTPSPVVQDNIGVAALTTSWTRYTFTFTWPSIAGKTLGSTANTSFAAINFYFSCPAANTASYPLSGNLGAQSGTINIWGVQLELGSQATPFEHRDPETELALCQRFYVTIPAPNNFRLDGYSSEAGVGIGSPFMFPTTMRAAPTMTAAINSQTNVSSVVVNAVTEWGAELAAIATAAGQLTLFASWTASADL